MISKVINKEQFISERWLVRSYNTTISSIVTPSEDTNWTINTQVLVESITNRFTIEEKPHTHQWIMIMEWWDKDMEVNVNFSMTFKDSIWKEDILNTKTTTNTLSNLKVEVLNNSKNSLPNTFTLKLDTFKKI
jgi:hypothetical protein